jgi:hypothetical protein
MDGQGSGGVRAQPVVKKYRFRKCGWGGNKMKNVFVKVFVIAMVCFGLTSIVQAVRPALPPKMVSDEPFVGISITPDNINLGIVSPMGFNSLPAKLEAHIVANCPHKVEASFVPFKGSDYNVTINPKHTSVEINGVKIRENGSGIPIVSSARPTPPEGVGVPVDIKFTTRNLMLYPAGQYKGSLVLTIMTRP